MAGPSCRFLVAWPGRVKTATAAATCSRFLVGVRGRDCGRDGVAFPDIPGASPVVFPEEELGAFTKAPVRFPGALGDAPRVSSPCGDGFRGVAVHPVGLGEVVGLFCRRFLLCCIRETPAVPPLLAPLPVLVSDADLRSCEGVPALMSRRRDGPTDCGLRSFAVSSDDAVPELRAADTRVMCLAFLSAMIFSCLRFSAISASSRSAVLGTLWLALFTLPALPVLAFFC